MVHIVHIRIKFVGMVANICYIVTFLYGMYRCMGAINTVLEWPKCTAEEYEEALE